MFVGGLMLQLPVLVSRVPSQFMLTTSKDCRSSRNNVVFVSYQGLSQNWKSCQQLLSVS